MLVFPVKSSVLSLRRLTREVGGHGSQMSEVRLRDLPRALTQMTRERGQIVQRLEKLLEDTGVKLSAVASDLMGASGRALLEALIRDEGDPQTLADLARRKLRNKIPELTEALPGRSSGRFLYGPFLPHRGRAAAP